VLLLIKEQMKIWKNKMFIKELLHRLTLLGERLGVGVFI